MNAGSRADISGEYAKISRELWTTTMRALAGDDDEANRTEAFEHMLLAAPPSWGLNLEMPDEASWMRRIWWLRFWRGTQR